MIRIFESAFDITEIDRQNDADVVERFMDLGRIRLHRFQHIGYRRQNFVFDIDQFKRFDGGLFIHGRNSAEFIADVTDFFTFDGHLVDGVRKEIFVGTEFDIVSVFRGDDRFDAGKFFGFGGIDAQNPRVRMFAADHFTDKHVGETYIKHIFGLAGDDPFAVDARNAFADGFEIDLAG